MRFASTRHLVAAGIFLISAGALNGFAQDLSEPEKNFEQLWRTYDRNYALFGVKNIDWDLLYKVYRPRVTPQTTDDELFDVMAALIGNLNDNHVGLTSPTRAFRSGILGAMKMDDYSADLIKEKYLKGRSKELMNGLFDYGWLSDSVGYFHFSGFRDLDASTKAIDQIISEFKDAKAIVVDVRANGGGDDRVGKLIAGRFADRKRLYMKTQIRNGPKHDDFTRPRYWYVEPDGPRQFTRPVVLLTHRFSVSAAENFDLAMRVLPHVTLVGDATSGVFADVYGDRLGNGWRFSVSFKLFVDTNGFCWEGIGVPSDIRQTNTKQDIEEKRDRVLDLAIAMIDSGALKPQDEAASLRDIRESAAGLLTKAINEQGVDAALRAYRKPRAGKPESYYIDEEEMEDAADKLIKAHKPKEALEVLKLNAQEFPSSYLAHELLADAYAVAGDSVQSLAHYKKAFDLNRHSYPWETQSYEDAKKIAAGIRVLAKELARNIESKGADAALKAFDEGKAGGPGAYSINESQINGLGYQLINQGKLHDAIEVLKLNVREFPNSSNVYDSLGEAYMKAGQTAQAIANYKKSLDLNPQNTNATGMLKTLEQPPTAVDVKSLDAYLGQYDAPIGKLTITRRGDRLFGEPEGDSKEELIPQSENRFSVPTVGADLTFVKDANGQVTHVLIRVGGREMQAKKVK